MNTQNAKDFIPLIQALAEGKTIQTELTPGTWIDVHGDIMFNSPPRFYRIKPEPQELWAVIDDQSEGYVYRTKLAAIRVAAASGTPMLRVVVAGEPEQVPAKPKLLEFWVNKYCNRYGELYESKTEADAQASPGRLLCIHLSEVL